MSEIDRFSTWRETEHAAVVGALREGPASPRQVLNRLLDAWRDDATPIGLKMYERIEPWTTRNVQWRLTLMSSEGRAVELKLKGRYVYALPEVFIDAVQAGFDLSDSSRRAVAADWLEEHGEETAAGLLR
jgi:hypothetical protein